MWLRRSFTRRRALAAGAGLLTVSLAGCTRISEFIVGFYVGDVNLFNTTDVRLTGSLELVDPDGRTLLEESLDLVSDSDDGDEGEPAAIYEDVLATAGPHQLTIDLDATTQTDAVTVEETLEIVDPDEEQIVIFLGEEFTGEFVAITVVEDFAELEAILEDA